MWASKGSARTKAGEQNEEKSAEADVLTGLPLEICCAL
jgi:hypothetical protein